MGDTERTDEATTPKDPNPEAGKDAHEEAVDHDRKPGVPPPTNEDVEGNKVDEESAQSFPASDPPANY